ncbi:MAG: RNA methyltransferase [Nitrososphaeraceae archaeon]|nr:RNA methyltransferase [Nitrososphaeraceae archaeon]
MNTDNNNHINLEVAIPSSSLVNDKTLRDKTLKISKFARSFSIFGVRTVYIYQDNYLNHNKKSKTPEKNRYKFKIFTDESSFLKLILEYLDTPQYLRKLLYPMSPELKYAGLLEPLNSPHHMERIKIDAIKEGDLRIGVVRNYQDNSKIFKKISKYGIVNNQSSKSKPSIHQNITNRPNSQFVDVGLDHLIPFIGKSHVGKKLTVKFFGRFPNIIAQEASEKDLKKKYWGYQVYVCNSLYDFLKKQINKKCILLTSREGKNLKEVESDFKKLLNYYNNNLLVVYGSPKKDLNEICTNISKVVDINSGMYLNLFSEQHTKTIRLEEAILGSLSILNYILKP